LLLGIKYEAAILGDLGDVALAGIEKLMEREVGEAWASDDPVLEGRNAGRRERGLPGLGESGDGPSGPIFARHSLLRRLPGR
jgi:hypothetical protein